MAWTYDPSNLDTATSGGRINVVRLLVGDTETLDQQLQDEEVTFALSESGDNVYTAASWCARTLSSKYARRVDTSIDQAIKANYSDLSRQYKTLAENLEYQAKKTSGGVGVSAGGVSKAKVQSVRENTDRITPSFRRDRFHNPPGYDFSEYE